MSQITTNSLPQAIERKLLAVIELQKQMDNMEAELKAELMQAMEANDIVSIKNDSYQINLIERSSFKGDINNVPAEMLKTALDTAKVSTYKKLYGQLPQGVEESKTKYISWRAK